jgi:hypothetical protein
MSAALRLLSAPPTIALPWTAIAWTTGSLRAARCSP